MNTITAVQSYVTKMIESIRGMKVLLLDHETMGILSIVFTQSEILQQEVYLFDLLETPKREVMTHLKCICFLRPTQENLEYLTEELKKPKYEQYNFFFTNTLQPKYLEDLAQADEHEVVHQVQEFYADYYAINVDTFSLNIDSCLGLSAQRHQEVLERTCDGLASILLSLKKRPVIRYERSSELAQRSAQELARRMQSERALFNFTRGSPVLLILDRRSDPVTPLLMQWTYQAMVHELIGIQNNRVKYNISGKANDIVLSQLQDEFFRENLYSNFGDLAINIKKKVNELSAHSQDHKNLQTIEDMKKFIQSYPEYQKLQGNVDRHVTLLQDLSNLTHNGKAFLVSEVEQELAIANDHSTAVKMINEILSNPAIDPTNKLKVLMLYALRYEKHSSNQLPKLFGILHQTSGLDQRDVNSLMKTLLMYAGSDVRSGDVFANKSWLAKAKNSLKRGMQGATNVYTQHRPLLTEQLTDLIRGKLSDALYPAISDPKQAFAADDKPTDIIVFFVGGATYEEAFAIHELKKENPEFANIGIVIGGTTIHNSASFLKELRKLRDASMS